MTAVDQRPAVAPIRPDRTQAALFALSDERDLWLRRVLDAERRGYARGREAGFGEGYRQAEADQAEQHKVTQRLIHAAIAPTLDSQGWAREQAADAARRVRAAEAAERRDAAERERVFVAKAYNTRADQRTPAQAATVQAYPPDFGRQR